ncbi:MULTISPECIES: hypothetical protein [Marinobacter]|jgi:hypothetical protein|nr:MULTISPECIES: hypothetical protein [Marinobacter]MDX5439085.1 hypothetical protein [Alteromonadaceae bacterium]MDX5328864.1 hypothetical protein [Marinobacter sp.]MDX5336012.1 hypothetical protein [Marinobacter sp.]MDX5387056.1 hypothetical protein [Marinobacter sp.]MDX5472430.1 hypothetical protein [Marinobacter sp.]
MAVLRAMPADQFTRRMLVGCLLVAALAVSIVKDLVQLYGGQLSLVRSELGGLKVSAWFPARAL